MELKLGLAYVGTLVSGSLLAVLQNLPDVGALTDVSLVGVFALCAYVLLFKLAPEWLKQQHDLQRKMLEETLRRQDDQVQAMRAAHERHHQQLDRLTEAHQRQATAMEKHATCVESLVAELRSRPCQAEGRMR